MKLAKSVLVGALSTFAIISYGQNSVGIGVASPNKNAVLELISPGGNQGLLVPKLTTAQRTASTFTANLSAKENGLLVFDKDENKFYYWEASVWKEMASGSNLLGGDGITIVNNTVSVIPQDLVLAGNILKITNNSSATSIDLTPFAGANTDDQTLTYNATTGALSISRITGGPQSVTVTSAGTAGGDLTGTYPNPTVNNNAITSAKIADGSVSLLDHANNSVNSAIIVDNTITSADILDGTIANVDIAGLAVGKLTVGTNGQVLTTSGGTAQWANPSGTTLINNAGTNNLFAGQNVGGPGASSSDNAFFGYSAGAPTSNGQYNVAFGSLAGVQNTNGNLNTLIGWAAGSGAAGALFNGNTFIGARAGQLSTSGPSTFVGERAGVSNTTGTQNVFMGNGAGDTNTTGAQNTIIGYDADVSAAGLLNATAIGYQANVDASNKIRLGNAAVTVIQGQVAFTAASDRRLKTNILPIAYGLDFIMKLKPVSYNMKNSSDSRLNWGFIAQDIESLVGDTNAVLTVGADKDRTLGLRYTDFVAPLVQAVQDLNNKLVESERKYAELEAELEKIKQAIGLKAEKK